MSAPVCCPAPTAREAGNDLPAAETERNARHGPAVAPQVPEMGKGANAPQADAPVPGPRHDLRAERSDS